MANRYKSDYYLLSKEEQQRRLKEIASVFFKLGTTAFGGPAAHIAMMDDEIVKKRKWLDKGKFMDLLGATNLIPGPNSTELAIHLGLERGGWRGLILAGTCFIFPAMVIVMAFAYIYVAFGSLPEVSNILYGIKPVIIAIVIQALIRLGKTAVKGLTTAIIGVIVIVLSFLGVNEIILLFLAGISTMAIMNMNRLRNTSFSVIPFVLPLAAIGNKIETKGMNLPDIFFTFLKIGSVLYGSGYVLLAFLESDFVERLGVLTSQQILDAVAVGQFTPGPVFTTASFIGYILNGVPGGVLATIGIFLPAFLLVGLLNPLVPKLRSSKIVSSLLDGVNVASLGLMAVVSWKLGVAALIDAPTIIIAQLSLILIIKFKVNSAWLIIAGGLLGFLISVIK